MKKDFEEWHNQKARIHESKKRPGFHEREIWWCALGVNVGFEQDGGGKDFLRPVFDIIQFEDGQEVKRTLSTAILSQVRLIDASRLSHKFGDIVSVDFEALTKKFKALLP